MKEHLVYVLYSPQYDKIYCGVTSDLIDRYRSHNRKGTKGWTKAFRPWIVIHVEVYQTRLDALKREKSLKSAKGREWIPNEILLNYL